MTTRIGIVICSRTDSKRLPKKPFRMVHGKYLISHLLDRLTPTGLPVYIAVPQKEMATYQNNLANYIDGKCVFLFGGDKDDPLKRTRDVAAKYDLDHVVRITHDKIFISYKQLDTFISFYLAERLDYIYSTNFIPGMGFEVFSRAVLNRAADTFSKVEHISYAVESVAERVANMQHFPNNRPWLNRRKPNAGLRLLIDYPEDLANVEMLMTNLGTDCDIAGIAASVANEPQPNATPDITVYTCSYEHIEHLDRCIQSVLGQSFPSFEYILIDDGSTSLPVYKFMGKYRKDKRVKVVRNSANLGLASSSNVANAMARGRYVIRLDADDYFVDEKILERMARYMEEVNADILYPHNYKDGKIQDGCEQHHVGGTMFKKRTLDYLRFTDGLRHLEGLDLYHRAVLEKRRIKYFREPTFYYRQRADSLSKSNSDDRQAIAAKIESGTLGSALVAK